MATIGVTGRHRPLRPSRSPAHPDLRAQLQRTWLAPLLALLAIGLLPVLGHTLVRLGTAATDVPAHETTSPAPAGTPAPTAGPTPLTTPSAVVVAPATANSSPSAATSASRRPAGNPRRSAPSSPATVPPVVVAPTAQNLGPTGVQQPADTSAPDGGATDQTASESTSTDTDSRTPAPVPDPALARG